MTWFTDAKVWFMSWFTDANKLKILKLIQGIQVFIQYAEPVVEHIDKALKPLLKDGNMPAIEAIVAFIGQYSDDLDEVLKQAEKYAELPFGDMLAKIALFCVTQKVSSTVDTSFLKLAIEIAYNTYKLSVKSSSEYSMK